MNKKYTFSKNIQNKLEGFKAFLQKQGGTENTTRQTTNYTGYFLEWAKKEQLQIKKIKYTNLLDFINYCKQQGKSKRITNRKLGSIRSYYKYLQQSNPKVTNPAANLFVRGVSRGLPSGLTNFETLEKLYTNYKTETLRDKRNKTILGLLIYQGVTTEELKQLEPCHLLLKEGKIYVPGNRRRNSRKLDLKPFQVLELLEYKNGVRQQILKGIRETNPLRTGRKPDKINLGRIENQLFISINGSENIKNSLLHLFRGIQKTNPEIQNAKQIRASVITYWLKNYNLRQVQYMAGHKYVSSTERYQLNNIESLQKKIEQFHPLR